MTNLKDIIQELMDKVTINLTNAALEEDSTGMISFESYQLLREGSDLLGQGIDFIKKHCLSKKLPTSSLQACVSMITTMVDIRTAINAALFDVHTRVEITEQDLDDALEHVHDPELYERLEAMAALVDPRV